MRFQITKGFKAEETIEVLAESNDLEAAKVAANALAVASPGTLFGVLDQNGFEWLYTRRPAK